METKYEAFKSLHQQEVPLLIGNVWNAKSALAHERSGYKAIATSSAAVAESMGYTDGEAIPFDEYFYIIQRIAASTSLPFSVDLEGGFGKTTGEIVSNIQRLHSIGVCGINIEDSVVEAGTRSISNAAMFAEKLAAIISAMKNADIEIFINARVDTFLLQLPDALEESLKRIKLYQSTGIHGLFFPCATNEQDISTLVNATDLPVNIMCMPNLPDFKTLQKIGVKRISSGPFVSNYIYTQMEKALTDIKEKESFQILFT